MAEGAPSGAPAGGVAEVAPAPSVEQAPGGSAARAVPIPPKAEKSKGSVRPVLPGVVSNEEGAELIPDIFGKKRNERGQFRKAEEEARAQVAAAQEEGSAPGEVAPEKPELPAGEVEAPEVKAKFKFAGKEYETAEQAEQAHKSLQGMFKPLETAKKQAEADRDYGYQAATAWQKEHDRVAAENAELKAQLGRGGKAPSQNLGGGEVKAPTAGDLDLDSMVNGIDTDAFEALAVSHGLPMAGKYLAGQVLKGVMEKIVPALKAEYQSALAPFQSEASTRQAVQQADQVINSVASLRTSGGDVAFPELHDAAKIAEVGKFWRESGLPIEHAMTAQGLITAISLYRTMNGFAAPPAVTTPEPDAPVPGPAATISADGRGAPPNAGRSHLSPAVQRFMTSFGKTDVVDKTLGFARNR